jgi:beta-N-acetylhexosaminidase
MKKLLVIAVSIIFTLSLIGCGKNNEEKIGIRGEITKVTLGTDSKTIFIMVEGEIEKDTQFDKASVTITDKTKVIESATKNKLSSKDLKEGMKVEVLVDGPVRESYPVQFDAKEVRVIK